jgi:hypothetical protein
MILDPSHGVESIAFRHSQIHWDDGRVESALLLQALPGSGQRAQGRRKDPAIPSTFGHNEML